MGTLSYNRVDIEFDDRTLNHLQVVMVQKLRQNESFIFSWRNADTGRRRSVWMHPTIPLYFEYSDSQPPTMSREWIAELTQSANDTQGLIALGEPTSIAVSPPATRRLSGQPVR
ncbi:MAG: hypothetical protein ABWX59_03615 [Microbacteriaceae bacterium]